MQDHQLEQVTHFPKNVVSMKKSEVEEKSISVQERLGFYITNLLSICLLIYLDHANTLQCVNVTIWLVRRMLLILFFSLHRNLVMA